ncbi:unnamed protein product [Caenorhabditis auriculariae]|uniref:rRNA biogenesis protein RRP36 n=1 Tax=Caenorhabditis auriculariae TaxID=2777116 RepID=A0A8S1HAF7_9PELO|nr:unnamed protein product [Caenorhabditis auriculariae]
MEAISKGFPKKTDQTPFLSPPSLNRFQKRAEYQANPWIHRQLPKYGRMFKADFRGEELKWPENVAQKSPVEEKTSGKKNKKEKNKKTKGKPVKGTSQEFAQLDVDGMDGRSDEDDVIDVTDMLPSDLDDVEGEVPMVNSKRKKKKVIKKSLKKKRVEDDEEMPLESSQRATSSKLPKEDDEDDESDFEESVRRRDRKAGGNDSEEDEDEDEAESERFREEMSNLPLNQVRAMKDKLGIKLFNKTFFGVSKEEAEKKKAAENVEQEKLGQHRPKEISSKRPVSAFREIYGQHEMKKKKKWDPRFDSRAGDFKEQCFDDNYGFLNEIRGEERTELIAEMDQATANGDLKRAERLRKMMIVKNIERMLRGEKPVYKTKAEVRKLEMNKKFEQLKKTNKLDKYLERKAKQAASKERKKKPSSNFEQLYGYQ